MKIIAWAVAAPAAALLFAVPAHADYNEDQFVLIVSEVWAQDPAKILRTGQATCNAFAEAHAQYPDNVPNAVPKRWWFVVNTMQNAGFSQSQAEIITGAAFHWLCPEWLGLGPGPQIITGAARSAMAPAPMRPAAR